MKRDNYVKLTKLKLLGIMETSAFIGFVLGLLAARAIWWWTL